jgi:hypothetical protein
MYNWNRGELKVTFRAELISKINTLYRDAATKKKSIDMDWRRIQGYLQSFIEEIADVSEFACASITDNGDELMLAAEGCELRFCRQNKHIDVMVNDKHYDSLYPTLDGYCVNYDDQKLLEVIDEYMQATFKAAINDLVER